MRLCSKCQLPNLSCHTETKGFSAFYEKKNAVELLFGKLHFFEVSLPHGCSCGATNHDFGMSLNVEINTGTLTVTWQQSFVPLLSCLEVCWLWCLHAGGIGVYVSSGNRPEAERETPSQLLLELPVHASDMLGINACVKGCITRVECKSFLFQKKATGFSGQGWGVVLKLLLPIPVPVTSVSVELWGFTFRHQCLRVTSRVEAGEICIFLNTITLWPPHLYQRSCFKFVKVRIPFYIFLCLIRCYLTSVTLRDGNSVIRALTLFWILKTLLLFYSYQNQSFWSPLELPCFLLSWLLLLSRCVAALLWLELTILTSKEIKVLLLLVTTSAFGF